MSKPLWKTTLVFGPRDDILYRPVVEALRNVPVGMRASWIKATLLKAIEAGLDKSGSVFPDPLISSAEAQTAPANETYKPTAQQLAHELPERLQPEASPEEEPSPIDEKFGNLFDDLPIIKKTR